MQRSRQKLMLIQSIRKRSNQSRDKSIGSDQGSFMESKENLLDSRRDILNKIQLVHDSSQARIRLKVPETKSQEQMPSITAKTTSLAKKENEFDNYELQKMKTKNSRMQFSSLKPQNPSFRY